MKWLKKIRVPRSNMQGLKEIRSSYSNFNVIFIHGITSSDECWKNEDGIYWTDLLKEESEFKDVGIYTFSYKTGFNSGTYSLSQIVDSLRDNFFSDDFEFKDSSGVIFVGHSMGGIVARRFLVQHQTTLIEEGPRTIGLFLVASPSLGSNYANFLESIASLIGHTQAKALTFSHYNVWLNDLDSDFMRLKDKNRKLRIIGKELIEELPPVGKEIFKTAQVVPYYSASRYFSDSSTIRDSNHISIAKPSSREAEQHRLLVQFIRDVFDEAKSAFDIKESNDLNVLEGAICIEAESTFELEKKTV